MAHRWPLPDRPQLQHACSVLDLDAHPGQLLHTWAGWRAAASRPRMLHYVAWLPQDHAEAYVQLIRQAASDPHGPGLAACKALAHDCEGLDEGFHRKLLEEGHFTLTLCVGGSLQELLRELHMQADMVVASGTQLPWDRWLLKALLRHCKRGAQLYFNATHAPAPALLAECGLQTRSQDQHGLEAEYAPHWPERVRNTALRLAAQSPNRCAVVGAGLAGASVAAALALRGWQVRVHEQGPTVASGASGLPAGLLCPHVSADDSPRSRLSRSGVRLMRQHARALLAEGQDWLPCGVLERDIPADGSTPVAEHWHEEAAWIRPARLVAAWLQQPGIEVFTRSAVAQLQRHEGQWLLLDAQGVLLDRADVVVMANAHGCLPLLAPHREHFPTQVRLRLDQLQVLRGTLSEGAHTETLEGVLPPHPVNGHGSLIAGVPTEQGPRWYAGSTFETDTAVHADVAGQHRTNLEKLRLLLPAVAAALEPQFRLGELSHWQGERCVSQDRMPLAGPLQDGPAPSLWISAAMGARGLSFAALCAELLAAQLCGEPWPVPASLAAKLLATRMTRGGQEKTD